MAILDFEKPLYEIQDKVDELKKLSETSGIDVKEQIKLFEKQAQEYKKELYNNYSNTSFIQKSFIYHQETGSMHPH